MQCPDWEYDNFAFFKLSTVHTDEYNSNLAHILMNIILPHIHVIDMVNKEINIIGVEKSRW